MKDFFKNHIALILLCLGGFLGFADYWAPGLEEVGKRHLFLTPDAMVFLGVTILVSLLGYYLVPDFLVSDRRTRSPGRGAGIIRGAAIALVLGSLVYALYLVNQHILHSFLSSGDEHSCYFLAECLRRGRLYVEVPPLADFFKVAHVGMRDGKWFSVYPLGWPLIWAAGLNFNVVDWLNPVLSALAVFFFYLSGSRLFGRLPAALGLALMALSPFFMFTGASYFSHATCLLAISVFLYAFLRWREGYEAGRDPVGWAALCGFAAGYGLMTRYLTMAAVAVPFLLYHFLSIFFEWKVGAASARPALEGGGDGRGGRFLRFLPFTLKRSRLRKSDLVFAGVVALFMLSILVHNRAVTGKLFKAPNKYDKSWERLGFRKDYTVVDGLFYVVARIFHLMDWIAPGLVAVYFFVLANLRGIKRPSAAGAEPVGNALRVLFRLSMVFIAFAYFFYYSWGGNQWGPRYYWEGLPFLCIAAADWIVSRWQTGSLGVRKFVLAFVVASIVISGAVFLEHAQRTAEASRQRRALYDLVEQTLKKPAIVFIHGFLGDQLVMAEEDAVRNSPFLDTRVLYAHDLGKRNKELMALYPGREYYRGTYDRARLQPRLEVIRGH